MYAHTYALSVLPHPAYAYILYSHANRIIRWLHTQEHMQTRSQW